MEVTTSEKLVFTTCCQHNLSRDAYFKKTGESYYKRDITLALPTENFILFTPRSGFSKVENFPIRRFVQTTLQPSSLHKVIRKFKNKSALSLGLWPPCTAHCISMTTAVAAFSCRRPNTNCACAKEEAPWRLQSLSHGCNIFMNCNSLIRTCLAINCCIHNYYDERCRL